MALMIIGNTIGRAWPVALTTGVGIGMSYADCDRSFGVPRIPGTRVIPPKSAASPLQAILSGSNETSTRPPTSAVAATATAAVKEHPPK